MNEAIIIQDFKFFNSFFIWFIDILSHKAKKKDKLFIFKNLAKFLEIKTL